MCGLAIAASAAAQTNTFDIPEGELKTALDAYARQSGVRLVYLSQDVRDRRTPGARGDMPQQAALARLLEGTGLTVKRDPSGAVAIVRENAAAGQEVPSATAPFQGQDDSVAQAGLTARPSAAAASDVDPATLDAVRVTGSHIKRAQM